MIIDFQADFSCLDESSRFSKDFGKEIRNPNLRPIASAVH